MEQPQANEETSSSMSTPRNGNRNGSSKLQLGSALKKSSLASQLRQLHRTKSKEWMLRYIHGLLLVPGNPKITSDLKQLHLELSQEKP